MFLKKKDNTLGQYSDPTGEFTNRSLRLSTWYVSHKFLLQRIGTAILIVWCVFSGVYGVISWGHYVVIGLNDDARVAERQQFEFQDYQSQHVRYGAADLQVQDVRTITSVPGRYDFLALVGNPNARWVAFIKYQFTYSGGTTASAETVLLPGVQRPVMAFGEESLQFPVGVSFEIVDVQWWNIDAHAIKDITAYANERIAFAVDNVEITPAGFGSDLSFHRIEFDMKNNSAYSYADAPFYVVLKSGNTMTGVIPHTFPFLRSGETVHVDLRSGIESLQAIDIELIPLIDIFSQRSFLAPSG